MSLLTVFVHRACSVPASHRWCICFCSEFVLPGIDAAVVRVEALSWNCESDLLAVRLASRGGAGTPFSALQLWHRENYTWFMKWERQLGGGGGTGVFTWDPEDAYRLAFVRPSAEGDALLEVSTLCWSNVMSRGNCAAAAIVNGGELAFSIHLCLLVLADDTPCGSACAQLMCISRHSSTQLRRRQ